MHLTTGWGGGQYSGPTAPRFITANCWAFCSRWEMADGISDDAVEMKMSVCVGCVGPKHLHPLHSFNPRDALRAAMTSTDGEAKSLLRGFGLP